MINPKVITQNGERTLHPVFCEITGKQICWQTDWCLGLKGSFPAYVSFKVVGKKGKVKKPKVLLEINTF